jgi:hypothetical protein
LTQLVCDLIKAETEDLDVVVKEITKEKNLLDDGVNKVIVISREIMSGDLFSFYQNSDVVIDRLVKRFDEVHFLCSLRFQTDWLISCYRESIHEHHYQGIEEFLGIKRGKNNSFVSNDYRILDYDRIIRKLVSNVGEKRVTFFFYESLKKNKLNAVTEMANAIGLDSIDIVKDKDVIPNRGYSALAIKLSLFRYKLLKAIGLSNLLVHRPIYFFGPKGIPAGFKELSALPVRQYWEEGFLQDNEEVRSRNYPNLSFLEKIRKEFSWRNFIKRRFDKLVYCDWDLLAGERKEIDEYFRKMNKRTFKTYGHLFGDVPDEYL